MTNIEQATRYLAKCPPAISGSGGHNVAFATVCTVVNGFALSEDEAMHALHSWNLGCDPAWKEHELRHKIRDAVRASHDKPRGHKLRSNGNGYSQMETMPPSYQFGKREESIIKLKPVKYDIKPDDIPEPIQDGCRELITKLFRPGEGIRIAPAHLNPEGKEIPDGGGCCFTREDWLRRLNDRDGDPNRIFSSSERCGIYIAINPYKPGATRDADVIDMRHALIEFDEQLSQEEQLNLYLQMKLPCAAIIDSGGKSIHAWVKIDARDRAEYDERVRILYAHFQAAGLRLDDKNKNPGRLSRLPNCIRFDRRQELLYINAGLESWADWINAMQADEIGDCDSFATLSDLDPESDPNCVVGFIQRGEKSVTTRYLCRGKAAWLLGPSGIGKSTLMTDFAIPWALGRPAYGISVGGIPRKSLIVQAENDRYDLAEMVKGVGSAHGLDSEFNPVEWEQVRKNVLFKTETRKTGAAFVEWIQRLIERERPDFVWIDPMLAFMGLDVNKQSEVTHFLRTLLTPVLEATGVVLIGIHHTGKPPGAKITAHWTAIDYAYAGLGSSELVNWARAVMFLKPVDDINFELKLAKRGSRAKATHPNGEWTTSVWLRHAQTGIRWEQIEPPSETNDHHESDDPKPEKIGVVDVIENLAKNGDMADFFSTFPADGLSLRKAGSSLRSWFFSDKSPVSKDRRKKGMGDTKARECIQALQVEGFLIIENDLYVPKK